MKIENEPEQQEENTEDVSMPLEAWGFEEMGWRMDEKARAKAKEEAANSDTQTYDEVDFVELSKIFI